MVSLYVCDSASTLATGAHSLNAALWFQNMMIWECGIPGREGTPWEGGLYTLDLHFPPEYPGKPPRAAFAAGFFHVNVFPSGKFVDVRCDGLQALLRR